MSWISITPRDPIVARDGRPFSVTQRRMRSLEWPYPSVLAGSLRTLLAKLADLQFTAAVSDSLRQVEVAGPLPVEEGTLFFPAPADIAIRDDGRNRIWFAARPRQSEAGGCNFPHAGLLPVILPWNVEEFKPARAPAFWSNSQMTAWLLENGFQAPPAEIKRGCGFLNAPDSDVRTHVFIEAGTGAAREGRLFQTAGLSFPEGVSLAGRVENAGRDLNKLLDSLNALHPLGGERRLAHWTSGTGEMWEAPEAIIEGLGGAKLVRMVLATPAIFAGGWRPKWVGDDLHCSLLEGSVKMRLVGVSIQRWRAISGWNLEASEKSKPGPKRVKRAVPAGGVYFFQVDSGDAAELARRLWLRPVSDDPQDCRDGFGLALWGPWSEI